VIWGKQIRERVTGNVSFEGQTEQDSRNDLKSIVKCASASICTPAATAAPPLGVPLISADGASYYGTTVHQSAGG